MLKWLVHCLKKFLKFSFSRKQTSSLNPGVRKVVQPPPELTNSDLEFLFTQLLEGVHQARGQQWALKYLERMENRISTQRWIDWLLDFGEKMLMSPAPNNQLATRMVQLGELGIGKIGELAYDIGTSLLTRNLGEPQHEIPQQDALSTVYAPLLTTREQGLTHNLGEFHPEIPRQDTKTVMPAGVIGELIWEYDNLDTETTSPVPIKTPPEEEGDQAWVEKSPEAASEATKSDESLALQPNVAVTLDELFVRLEQSSDLAQQLASGLGMEIAQSQTHLERSQTWFYQGLQQAKTGELLGAITSYDKAIEINPHSYEYWFNRGLTLFYLGDFAKALASYDKAIEIKPNFYKGWYNRGTAQGELGRFEDAIVSFDKAIEIKEDYHQAWSSRGWAFLKLGRPEDAIFSYDQALLVAPQDQENWYYRGLALVVGGRTHDAIASFEQAIEIQPDFHLGWYNRGVELSNLGRFEDALASLEQAIEINPDFHEGWYALGSAQDRLGRVEKALASYDHAIQINPNFHEVFIDKGVVLASLGRWNDAILAWEKALEVRPDFYLGWFNQAIAWENLGRREDALASYDKAIEINPDFHLAWYNRGVALFYLGRFEDALASYDNALQIQLDYWEAWIGRGTAAGNAVNFDSHLSFFSTIAATNPALNERGYEGKLASYEEGLKYVHQHIHPEGWGRLHLLLGNAHYDRGKRHPTPHHYWHSSVAEYYLALETLTPEVFPQLHLDVLQNLIKTLLGLEQTNLAQEFQQRATDLLRCLLSEPNGNDDSKKAIALKFAGFRQLAVDIAVQSGELAQALEIAEYSKNACLSWLLFGWSDEIVSPNYASIQQLLNPTTAIIYWHISPCTLRTFILKYNSPEPIPIFTPVLNVAAVDDMPLPEAVGRLVEFEDWLEDWNQQYQEYRSQGQTRQNKSKHSWREDMEQRLFKLRNILNIAAIVQELEDITQLILIPHRDLHRFPLHALFHLSCPFQEERTHNDGYYRPELCPEQNLESNFTITYLPSVQLGLSLKSQPLWQIHKQPLLSVEHPNSTGYPALKFAKLETEAISQMFDNVKRIQGSKATKNQVENALSDNYNIFHFTGHGINNFSHPPQSELVLAGDDKLTLEEICRLQIANYNLVTLSACETAINSNQTITTEYVGLVSGLIFQGVSLVVSTLWTVESAASASVMIEFYRQIQQNKSADAALLAATEWLREVTASELKKWYSDLLHKLPQEGLRIRAHLATELYRMSKMPAEQKLYNHPYYWAAFTIAGK